MSTISPFWAAAAARSGRLDLSAAVRSGRAGALASLDLPALVTLGLRPAVAKQLLTGAPTADAGTHVTLAHPEYPRRLRVEAHAPPVLFHDGPLALLDDPCVAIVGSRRCTPGGRRFAAMLAAGLSAAGVTIVSGLAYGIDVAAHRAAGARTVAVLGHGLRWSPGSAALERMSAVHRAGGTLVSEFLPDHPAARWTFPQRNRVIAGLADLVIVVEANQRSGALITARLAADMGRDVMVVPGSPWSPASVGCLSLLHSGAAPLTCVEDALRALALCGHSPVASPSDPLLEALGPGCSLTELVARTGRSHGELATAMAMLELEGRVVHETGDHYAPRTNQPTRT